MEWDLQGEGREDREASPRAAVGVEGVALRAARVGSAFAPFVGRRRLTSKGFPVLVCAAQNAGPR